MSEQITLTADERAALSELIWNLGVIQNNGYFNEKQLVEITVHTWRDLIAKPAARLQRVAVRRRLPEPARPAEDAGERP